MACMVVTGVTLSQANFPSPSEVILSKRRPRGPRYRVGLQFCLPPSMALWPKGPSIPDSQPWHFTMGHSLCPGVPYNLCSNSWPAGRQLGLVAGNPHAPVCDLVYLSVVDPEKTRFGTFMADGYRGSGLSSQHLGGRGRGIVSSRPIYLHSKILTQKKEKETGETGRGRGKGRGEGESFIVVGCCSGTFVGIGC